MLSPGPANLVSFVLGARNGSRRILRFHCGILTIYAAVAICLGLLTTRVGVASPSAALALQALGGLFILYLAVQLIRRRGRDVVEKDPTFTNGVVLQILNPKFPGVVVAVFSSQPSEPALVTSAVIVGAGAIGLLGYSIAGTLLHSKATSSDGFRALDLLSGIGMVMVGVWFLMRPWLG